MDMTPTLIPATIVLPPSAADRCDRCGARGTTRIILDNGGDLVFCGHHTRKYDVTIQAVAVDVVTTTASDGRPRPEQQERLTT
jgi:hypothetical protein